MSKHYLLDLYQTDPWAAKLNEVSVPASGASSIDGSYVIRVTDDIPISETVNNQTDLLTEKYAGMLANSGLFTRIVYDDMFDPNGINMANSVGISTGVRGVCSIFPPSFLGTPGYPTPTMQMNMVTIPAVPVATQCMVLYEVFTYSGWDYAGTIPGSHAYRRSYQEEAEYNLECVLSFNNGATWDSVPHGELHNIAPADQGNQLIVRFLQSGAALTRFYLGSWAVLF